MAMEERSQSLELVDKIAALADADSYVRRPAASALVRIGPTTVPALIAALADADEDVRRSAAVALSRINSV